MAGASYNCKICGEAGLDEIRQYSEFARVTSDCKPWPAGGRMAVCMSCGATQKIMDEKWLKEVAAIYQHYEIYHQSAGVEQAVFDAETGGAQRRSLKLAEYLVSALNLPEQGSILDVGCGNGAMLAAFAEVRPDWALFGHDLGPRYLPVLKRLPNFRALYTCPPSSIRGHYSLISMLHALEHVPEPLAMLCDLRDRLAGKGRFFIQVPDCRINPFDLLVADHLLHFRLDTLALLIERAGYVVEQTVESLIAKELSLVARLPMKEENASEVRVSARSARPAVIDQLAWLRDVAAGARRAAALNGFGIFGTSISATWLFTMMPDQVEYFVDEDPSRTGKRYMDRPVYAPDRLPAGANVYIPLVPGIATNIVRRLGDLPIHFHEPPSGIRMH